MASLFDLVQQYLKRDNLPKQFTYDRTNQPGTPPPVTVPPQDPNAPTARILPIQGGGGGGGDGFSVYNPNPNNTRDSSGYQKRPYMEANPSAFFDLNNPNEMSGLDRREGLGGAIQSYFENNILGKVKDMLPVNRTGILQNELLGSGFSLNNIGQIVAADPGSAYDPSGLNVMAGYNASKVTKETFDKRRAKAKEKMSPEGFTKFNTALTAAEDKFFGATDRTKTVFDAESLEKNPDYISRDIINQKMQEGLEGEDDSDDDIDSFDPLNLNTTTAPGFMNFYNPYEKNYTTDPYASGQDDKDIDPGDGTGTTGSVDPAGINSIDSTVYANENNPNSVSTSGLTYNQGGGQDGSYDFVEQNFGGGNSSNYGTGSGNLGDYQIQPTNNNVQQSNYESAAYDSGSQSDSSSNSKIVCTMMNESYGFGSFRNKIWMKFHKDLSPEYQKGYHKIFLPLVRIAKTNKVVKKILEHIAVHSTIDMRQATRGKMHLLGRIYRKILLPLCYIVGKHGKSSS